MSIALTKRIEFEIRLRYELGDDLNDLALKYKIPLTTLNKRKKKCELAGDPWIKGCRCKAAYEKFTEESEKRRIEIEEEITNKARKEAIQLQNIIDDTYQYEDVILNSEVEKAVAIRQSRISGILELRRKIENILPDKEKAELEKIKVDIELKRLELKSKALDYKLQEEEAKHYLE